MGIRAAVLGGTGYAGGELLRLLDAHPDLEVGPVAAGSNAGRLVRDVHPHLLTLADRPLLSIDDGRLADVDIAFLALPHGQSAQIATTLPIEFAIVDLGAHFRLAAPAAWSAFYVGEHAGSWAYGLPELVGARENVAGAKRIANPGCYPTAILLALAPLLNAGVVTATDIVAVAVSGTSGSGRSPQLRLLGAEVMGDVSAYSAGGSHRHIPEMREALATITPSAVILSFAPLLAPMARGLLATCTGPQAGDTDTSALRQALTDAHDAEPFVCVLPGGPWPHTAATASSNACHLQVAADPSTGRAAVVAAIDNLGKGAAGQTIQNANLALGLAESSGLTVKGTGP
jgi:N-acetyl-gamma-glutamyl-phosphate reductase